ncbi:minor tail protein [Mycobacterium phage JacoRen57]|nr:minor tail protein [Mycobacterium phage JacoRen57]
MAVGWWAETFASSQTEFQKLDSDLLGAQSQFGISNTEFHKLETSGEALMWDSLIQSETQFKKLDTQASGGQVHLATSETSFKKMSTDATSSVAPPVLWQGTGPFPTGVGIPTQNNWTAPAGTDVFIAAVMDRSGSFTGATFGGDAGELVGEVLHNNNAARGRTALWRFAGKGNGTNKTFSITGSGSGWFGVCIFAFSNVSGVGPVEYAWGESASPTQTVTKAGVQILGRGAGGAGVGTPSAFSGVINKVNQNINGSSLAVNHVETPGVTGATTQNYSYGYIFLPLYSS